MTVWTDYVKTNRKTGETYKAALSRCAPGYQKSKPKVAVDKAAKLANIPTKPMKKDVGKPKKANPLSSPKPVKKVKKARKKKEEKLVGQVEQITSEY